MNLQFATRRTRPTWQSMVTAFAGLAYLLTGLAQLFAPRWFFDTIGTFPPFNRHYIGDFGVFIVALGIGLLAAAAEPGRHRLLVGCAALASALHVLNHLYDDWLSSSWSAGHFLSETLPLLVLALMLAGVWARPEP